MTRKDIQRDSRPMHPRLLNRRRPQGKKLKTYDLSQRNIRKDQDEDQGKQSDVSGRQGKPTTRRRMTGRSEDKLRGMASKGRGHGETQRKLLTRGSLHDFREEHRKRNSTRMSNITIDSESNTKRRNTTDSDRGSLPGRRSGRGRLNRRIGHSRDNVGTKNKRIHTFTIKVRMNKMSGRNSQTVEIPRVRDRRDRNEGGDPKRGDDRMEDPDDQRRTSQSESNARISPNPDSGMNHRDEQTTVRTSERGIDSIHVQRRKDI